MADPTGEARALPEAFGDLEPFVEYALASERERSAKRQASAMEELQAFYDAALPRLAEALDYLNRFALDAMPADAERLLHLTLALAEVGPAVEVYGAPRERDTLDPERFVPLHD